MLVSSSFIFFEASGLLIPSSSNAVTISPVCVSQRGESTVHKGGQVNFIGDDSHIIKRWDGGRSDYLEGRDQIPGAR